VSRTMVNKSSNTRRTTKAAIPICLSLFFCFANVAISADSQQRFERSYAPQHPAHLTISNVNGSIHVVSWEKKTIHARANAAPYVSIEDRVIGEDISISTKPNLRLGRADFEVSVPPETSLTIKNIVGNVELRGITGHVSVRSIDSDVRLVKVNSPAVDVVVTSGDIFFDGELHEGGSYSLQSMKGDLDVTLPGATPFNLNARALSENINLGSFLSSLSGSSRGPKGVSGTYLKGGSRLTLTAFAGRILLHKK
jgi:putative adhesin